MELVIAVELGMKSRCQNPAALNENRIVIEPGMDSYLVICMNDFRCSNKDGGISWQIKQWDIDPALTGVDLTPVGIADHAHG